MVGKFVQSCLLAGWLFLMFFSVAFAQEADKNLLPNPSFEQGQGSDGISIIASGITWKKATYIKDPGKVIPENEKENRPDSQSTLFRVEGGCTGKYAAALKLDSKDQWILADCYRPLPQPAKPGDRYLFSVMAKSDNPVRIDLVTQVYGKANKTDQERVRCNTTGEWQRYENVLFLTANTTGSTQIRLIVQLYNAPVVPVLFDDVKLEKLD